MFRRRGAVTWLIVRLILYGSWAFGLLPFTFDPLTRQLRRHRWFFFYGVAINVFLLGLVVLLSVDSENTTRNVTVFKRNHLLVWIDVIIGILFLIASYGVHLITFSKSGQVLRIINEVLVLEHRHFGCLDVEDASQFNFYVIQRALCVVGQVLGMMVANLAMPELYSSLLFVVLLCVTQVSVYLVLMHFFLAILYIYRSVWLINRQILGIVSRLREDPLSDSSRIHLLQSLYVRLLALSKQLEDTYKGQIALMLITGLAGNIVIIYFLIVYTVSLDQMSISLIVFPYSLIMNVWDYWLSISVCDLTERTGRHTSKILKLFSDLEHTDVQLERSLNEFTLLCCHRRFRFSLYGFISVNYKMGFRMIVASFTYLLCLVQFDFMNFLFWAFLSRGVNSCFTMFRPRRGCRHKLVHFILHSILYSSWALGVFPFTYVAKKRRLRRSKWLLVYGIAFNTTLVVLMLRPHGGVGEPMANDPKLEVFQRNFVLEQISMLLGILGIITICAMYLRTFWRSRDLCRIYNQLLEMEVKYFGDYAVECPTFDRYVIQKGLLIVGGVASTLVIHIGMPKESVSLVKLGSFLLAIHFHLGVAFIYRFVWLINRELLDLANRLRVKPEAGSSARIHLLLSLYGRLLDLNARLTHCYDYQTAMMMTIFLGGNIIVSFYMIVYSVSLSQMSVFVMLIMFPLALVNNFLDFWLSIAVCDLAERTGRQTSMILKLFNDMETLDKELERSFSEFALFCSHRRLKFHHCGLFYVNYEMGFHMLVTSVLYLLFLVQFDYMNL